jgi:hypothetical protein
VNRTVTHVSVARPHYLDLETTPVSDSVKRIVEFIHAHPRCSRRQLFETLAPAAVATMQPLAEGAPVPELTPEASAVISDLHWLVHQGHVIEFANGTLETAKKPLPKPAKPAPSAGPTAAEAAATQPGVAPETAEFSAPEPASIESATPVGTEPAAAPTSTALPAAESARALAEPEFDPTKPDVQPHNSAA